MTSLWYSGNSSEQFVFYPTLFAHLLNLVFLPFYILQRLDGSPLKYSAFLTLSNMSPHVHLAARLLSAACGISVIYPLYKIGSRLGGRHAAIITIWIYAVAYLPVRDAHFGVTDQLAALATTFALWRCIEYNRTQTLRNAILAGMCAGWALASKYVVAPIPVLLLAHFWRPAGTDGSTYFNRKLVCLLLGSFLATAVLSPEVFTGWRGLTVVVGNAKHFNDTYAKTLPIGWIHFATFTLPYGIGIPCTLLACAMMLRTFVSRDRRALLPAVIVISCFAYAGSVHGAFSRYLDPVIPTLTLLAGLSISRFCAWLDRIRGKAAAALMATLLLISCCLPNLINDFGLLRLLAREDTRLTAFHWLEQNTDTGTLIAFESAYVGITNSRKLTPVILGKTGISTIHINNIRFLVLCDYVGGTLPSDREFAQQVKQRTDCELVKVISPYTSTGPKSNVLIEAQDLWFLPFVGFDGIEQPGPRIEIYAVK